MTWKVALDAGWVWAVASEHETREAAEVAFERRCFGLHPCADTVALLNPSGDPVRTSRKDAP